MGALIRAVVAIALVAGPARADDPPPPRRALGWSWSCGERPLGPGPAGERFVAGLGLQFGRLALGPLRAGVEYDWLLESATAEGVEGRGYGQRLGVAAHLPVLDGTMHARDGTGRPVLRGYLALEGGAGGSWIHDSRLGAVAAGDVFAGVRLGYEMFGDARSPSRRLDDYLSVRWSRHPHGAGFEILVGMEWGD